MVHITIFGYLFLRTNKNFDKNFQEMSTKINFHHPVVGIHKRRGDKVGKDRKHGEGAFVEENVYVDVAIKYFNRTFNNGVTKRIFVASDELDIYKMVQNVTRGLKFQYFHGR